MTPRQPSPQAHHTQFVATLTPAFIAAEAGPKVTPQKLLTLLPLPPTSGNDPILRPHTPAPRPRFLDVVSAVAKAWAQQTGPQPHPPPPSPPTHPAAEPAAATTTTASPTHPARGKPKARQNRDNLRNRGGRPAPDASPHLPATAGAAAPPPTPGKASPGQPAGRTTRQSGAFAGGCAGCGGEGGDGVLGRGGGGGPEGGARWRVWSGMRGAGSGPSPLTEGLAPAPPPPWAGFERPIGPGGPWEGTMVGTGGGGPPWRGGPTGSTPPLLPAFAGGPVGPDILAGPAGAAWPPLPGPESSVAWGGRRRGAWSRWDAGAAEMGRWGAEPAHQRFGNEAASAAAAAGG
jgi:hypothetical protein